MKKRILSMLLAIVMVVGLLPGTLLTAQAVDDVHYVALVRHSSGGGSCSTIEEAISEAKANPDSTIELLDDITATDSVSIDSGSFTIDLKGKTWHYSSYLMDVSGDAKIKIIDSSANGSADGTGKLLGTGSAPTITLCDSAQLEIAGGTVENSVTSSAVDMSSAGAISQASLIVSGGTVKVPENSTASAILAFGSSVKVTGGTFEGGRNDIYYRTGTIDLSKHNNPMGIKIANNTGAEVAPGEDTIFLPAGYAMLDSSGNAAATLANGKSYTVSKAPVTPPVTEYDLWVGGERVTSANAADVFGDGKVSFTPAAGDAPATLTLNNYTYTGEGHQVSDDDVAAIYYGGSEPLNLVLEGNSTVTQQSETAPTYSNGIYSSGGITVSGTGSLTATGGIAVTYSFGVWVAGNITVKSGNLTGISEVTSGYGVKANAITVEGGSLTGIGNRIGVHFTDSATINGGEIVASGTKWAFSKAPIIAEAFDAAVWYGDGEEAANANGAQDKSKLASAGDAKYVRIAPVTAYELWVGGVQVTSVNAYDVFNDGKVSYNADTNTLTLNNFTYEGEGYEYNPTYNGTAAIYSGLRGLTIELVGENKLTNTADGDGIYAGNTITISGIGSLEIVVNEGDGIRLNGEGDRVLTISDSNVSINAGEYGIANSTGTIVLTNGVFDITAGEYGIALEGTLTITNSTVEITAVKSAVAVSEFSLGEDRWYQWTTTAGSAMTSSKKAPFVYDSNETPPYLKIEPQRYDLYVGGVGMAEGDFLASGATETTTTAPASGGYAHYENGELTLNNYIYEDGGNAAFAIQHLEAPDSTLNIDLVGQSSVTLTNDRSMGLVAMKNVTVSGSGGLSIAGGDYGVNVFGDLTINSGELSTTGANTSGVHAFGSLTVNDGSLSAFGTDFDGVNVMGDLSVEGGSVTANGSRHGVNAMSNITVNGGSLTANGGSCGVNILPTKNVIVGADVKVYGADGQEIEEPDYSQLAYVRILVPAVASVTMNGETTNYGSLGAAIGAVENCTATDNAEVKLLKDVALGETQNINGGMFTLDLNGFTISSPAGVLRIESGAVILTDTSESKTGAITGRGEAICVSGGTVTIRDGTIQATSHEQPGLHYDAVTVTSGILRIEGGIIECDAEGVRAIGGEVIITGGSITGGTSDITTNTIYGTAVITLALAEGAETGAEFPGGLSVSSTTLREILADGAAYWQGDQQVTLTQNQSTISGGDVVVKKAVPVPPSDGENDDTTSGQPDWPDYSEPTYRPSIEDSTGGETTVSDKTPEKGDKVTITAAPEKGYELGEITVTDSKGNKVELTDNGDGTYTYVQPVGKVTITVTYVPTSSPSEDYSDLSPDAWYIDAVDYVLRNGLMNGVGGDKFDPNGTTSRAMIWTILARLDGVDTDGEVWYEAGQKWAMENGISDGTMANEPITREQFATILWRYAKYKGYDVSVGEDTNILSYEDAFDISEWAIPAMQWACGAGLMQGDGVNLTPKADATRAQAAALFQRFCENVAEK